MFSLTRQCAIRVRTGLEKSWNLGRVLEKSWKIKIGDFILEMSWKNVKYSWKMVKQSWKL